MTIAEIPSFRQKLRSATPQQLAKSALSRVENHLVRPVLGTIPRMLYGNDAGFRGNIRGAVELRRARAAAGLRDANRLSVDPRVQSFKEEGVVALGRPFTPTVMHAIRARYETLIEDDEGSCWNGVGRFRRASRAIKNPIHAIPELTELLTADIQGVVTGYYGSHMRVDSVRAWRTYHVDGLDTKSEAYSNQWHNDHFPVSLLRLFVYLSDGVTRETGAFRIHPIPSTRAIVRSGYYLHRSIVLKPAREALEDDRRSTLR